MPNVVRPESLEEYLRAIERQLQSLPPEERLEVIRELRSHVLDRVKGDLSDATVGAALARLGDPQEIARINLRARVAARSLDRRTPVTLGRALARLASLGADAVFTLVLSLTGYVFAGCWLLTAVAKPFAPDRVGLWLLPDATGDVSLSLGRHEASALGHDILGWWIIPIALVISIASAVMTYRYDLRFIRQLAKPQTLASSPSV